jgi:hypothetical protein
MKSSEKRPAGVAIFVVPLMTLKLCFKRVLQHRVRLPHTLMREETAVSFETLPMRSARICVLVVAQPEDGDNLFAGLSRVKLAFLARDHVLARA